VSTVKYDPVRGDVLITGGYDNTVRLFVGPNWTLVKTLAGHEGKVMCLDVTPGTRLARRPPQGTHSHH
jgi:U4/U6 small nuclear ribonucleoprotein PRP4